MAACIVFCPTYITEIGSTPASHFVTSLGSWDPAETFWALLAFVRLNIIIKLFLKFLFFALFCLFTGLTLMPFLLTFLTDALLACWAIKGPLDVIFPHKISTIRLRANKYVAYVLFHEHLHLNVLIPLKVLAPYHFLYFQFSWLNCTFWTFYWEFSLWNLAHHKITYTTIVIAMKALLSEWLWIWIKLVLIADRAGSLMGNLFRESSCLFWLVEIFFNKRLDLDIVCSDGVVAWEGF